MDPQYYANKLFRHFHRMTGALIICARRFHSATALMNLVSLVHRDFRLIRPMFDGCDRNLMPHETASTCTAAGPC
jgi:hypothetical protein